MPRHNNEFKFTDQIIARMREMWGAGKSTAEIGRVIGCGKNSAVGKMHRLGFPKRQNPMGQGSGNVSRARKAVQESRTAVSELIPLQRSVHETRPALRLYTGREEACQWPEGLPTGEPHCTAPRVHGKPYCAAHCERAYVRKAEAA